MPAEALQSEPSASLQKGFVEQAREPNAALGAAEAPRPSRIEPLSPDRYGVPSDAELSATDLRKPLAHSARWAAKNLRSSLAVSAMLAKNR
jgi:hypothetical protein